MYHCESIYRAMPGPEIFSTEIFTCKLFDISVDEIGCQRLYFAVLIFVLK